MRLGELAKVGFAKHSPGRMGKCYLVDGERPWMSRTLILLFRRDPSRDRHNEKIKFEGYAPYWPDGRPVSVSIDAFCKHGLRLLGLGKQLAGCEEKLAKLVCLPLSGKDDDLNRIPGYRVRRFYLHRTGNLGRLHFLDGTPTIVTFEMGVDEPRVLQWIGLNTIQDGEVLWFDLAVVGMDTAIMQTRPRMQAVEA